MKILVTGASGNVGREVVRHLLGMGHEVTAGTRDGTWDPASDARPARVDFEQGIVPDQRFDAAFLMRPPQIADPKLFENFLERLPRDTRIVFLSVQGADRKSYLPHAKIEKVIARMGFGHVFVRPSYFMENLLTTLWPELIANRRIYLPAGRLKLDWISVEDIAIACAAALTGRVATSSLTMCSGRRADFAEVCATVNRIAGTNIAYEPAGVLAFARYSRRQATPWSFIAVMLLLHFLPRFERARVDDCTDARGVLGRDPESLESFVTRHKAIFGQLG